MENLQDFMLLFRMVPDHQPPTVEQLNRMQQQWGTFIGSIAAQARLVSTSRLGFDRIVIDNLGLNDAGAVTGQETVSGNMIVKAVTLQEAAEMSKGCPVLVAGGSVEVCPIIPMAS